jgi:hypothetical protein
MVLLITLAPPRHHSPLISHHSPLTSHLSPSLITRLSSILSQPLVNTNQRLTHAHSYTHQHITGPATQKRVHIAGHNLEAPHRISARGSRAHAIASSGAHCRYACVCVRSYVFVLIFMCVCVCAPHCTSLRLYFFSFILRYGVITL